MISASKNRTTAVVLTTSNQDVYTAPNLFKSNIDSILVTNSTSSAVTVTMEWWNETTNVYTKLLGSTSIKAGGIVQITDCLAIEQKDVIRALASANSAITVTIRATETYTTSTLAT
jgi:hypothetical protein